MAKKTLTLISLRFSMLSIFVTMFVSAILVIIVVIWFYFNEAAHAIAAESITKTKTSVNDELTQLFKPVEKMGALSAKLIQDHTIDLKNTAEMVRYTQNVLTTLPNVAMAYWGDENGNFIIARRQADGAINSEIIDKNVTPAVDIKIYRNPNAQIIRQEKSALISYDPRLRPWYQDAKNQAKTTWSEAYLFFSANQPTLGITLATPLLIDGKLKGVFGMDVSLATISDFLAQQEIGHSGVSFVVNQKGELIAFPGLSDIFKKQVNNSQLINIDHLNQPKIQAAYHQFKQANLNSFVYAFSGKKILGSFNPLSDIGKTNWYIGIVVDADDFVGDVKKAAVVAVLFSFVVLLIGVILILIISKKIAASFNKLVKQTNEIKNFNLQEPSPIRSKIKEVAELSGAVSSMRNGLRAFKQYVPANLVRKLIQEGQVATIGGQEKKISIMFTDIANFTNISEQLMPEELMNRICIYFDELAAIITHYDGTIDKFIGDAVMAFWGAPITDEDQQLHACRAALDCSKRITDLNNRWEQEKFPRFSTRIGLHYGKAIVGNVGSKERLNYTALGDAINIANRLEAVNKIYGTHIIVSEQMIENVKDQFHYRFLDYITVKGKSNFLKIYELIDEKTKDLSYDLSEYQEYFEKAFYAYQKLDWPTAIKLFEQCGRIKLGDKVARIFIERCQLLMKTPPAMDWDGVWRLTEK